MSSYNQMTALASLGNRFIAGQGMLQNQRSRALQDQRYEQDIQAKQQQAQKSMIVKTAAERLMQNPQDPLNDLAPDVRFDTRLAYGMAMKQQMGNDKEEMAAGYERLKSLGSTALADIETDNPNWKKTFLAFQGHARDGIHKVEENQDGSVLGHGYDGRKHVIPELTKDQAANWVRIHTDPEQYYKAKTAEKSFVINNNASSFNKKEYAVGKNGIKGWVNQGLMKDMDGGTYDVYMISNPQTNQEEQVSPEQWKELGMVTDKEAKSWADIGKNQQSARESAIPTASKNVTIGNDTISKSNAFKTISMLSSQLFEKGSKAADVATMAVSALASGVKLSMADFKSGGANSPYAQALEKSKLNDAMGQKAKQYLAYIDAVTGGGGGSTSTQNKSWRDYKD